jgi:hypothetical protein
LPEAIAARADKLKIIFPFGAIRPAKEKSDGFGKMVGDDCRFKAGKVGAVERHRRHVEFLILTSLLNIKALHPAMKVGVFPPIMQFFQYRRFFKIDRLSQSLGRRKRIHV